MSRFTLFAIAILAIGSTAFRLQPTHLGRIFTNKYATRATTTSFARKHIGSDFDSSNYDLRLRGSSSTTSTSGVVGGRALLQKSKAPLALLATTAATFLFANSASASVLADSVAANANDSGFLQAFLLIFVSEIGDKTFFIAGLLAAKYGRFVSFTGSLGALSIMTVISCVLGQIFHAVPTSLTQGIPFDDYVAVAAFTYFGIKTLYDASQLERDNEGMDEEKAEAEEEVEKLTADQKRKSTIALIVQTFSLVFAAEIGDRSFLSTIALSAALNPFAVAAGAIGGHGVATGIAVAGGSLLSKYLSEKVIGYIGGSLFIVFAVTTAFGVF